MTRVFIALLLAGFSLPGPAAGPKDYSGASMPELIDSLQDVDRETLAMNSMGDFSGFMADSGTARFEGGVIGSPAPAEFPQMKEIVKRGATALPDLLEHLEDKRPTQLKIGGGDFHFMFSYFSEEYDPRNGRAHYPSASDSIKELHDHKVELPYTITVGDVCFALVGQITNRELSPVRYQPSAGLVINSPGQAPTLAVQAREDWTGTTSEQLRQSLVRDAADAQITWRHKGALTRLRFYFPEEYVRQKQGPLASAIKKFELAEQQENK